MPLTPEIVLTIQDAKGKTSNMFLPVPIPGTTPVSSVLAAARNWAEAVQDAISGRITRVGVALVADLGGLGIPAEPEADSDVEEGARLAFRSAEGFPMSFRIPTFREELFLPRTTEVDRDDTVIDGIIDRVIDGIQFTALPGDGDLDPSTSHGEDITAYDYGRSAFVRERG
jgi:hypothetical protein